MLSLLLLCSSCAQEKKWTLVWEENFDEPQLNTSVWSKIPRGLPDWKNYMSANEQCYALKDGNLILRGIVNNIDPSDTAKYLTGGVFTLGKKTFQNGRLEIRAKLQGAKGAWPAIWMLPERGKWPYGGEIDIMERLNHDDIAHQTIHSHYTNDLGYKKNPNAHRSAKIDPNGYNVYGVDLRSDRIDFYINGKLNFSYPKIKTDKEGQFPFDKQPFYLLIDMQLGGHWVGRIDPQQLPVEMKIDWVRFYQLQ